jgi:hypothetical protein
MKAIRQVDIPADAEMVARSVVAEDAMADKWIELQEHNNGKDRVDALEIKDASEFWFDQGGMVRTDEQEMFVEMDGYRFGVYLRHTDGLVRALRHAKDGEINTILGDHVIVRGMWWSLLLTVETAARLADLFEAEIEARADDIEGAWDQYSDDIKKLNGDGLCVLPRSREATD